MAPHGSGLSDWNHSNFQANRNDRKLHHSYLKFVQTIQVTRWYQFGWAPSVRETITYKPKLQFTGFNELIMDIKAKGNIYTRSGTNTFKATNIVRTDKM